jgi:hypothetical protein
MRKAAARGWNIYAMVNPMLEKYLAAPLAPNYAESIAGARDRLHDTDK